MPCSERWFCMRRLCTNATGKIIMSISEDLLLNKGFGFSTVIHRPSLQAFTAFLICFMCYPVDIFRIFGQ